MEPGRDAFVEPFPAKTKTAGGAVNGVQTEIMSVSFTDKIIITVSQRGRLAQWIHVPLDIPVPDPTAAPHSIYDAETGPLDLLPMAHLTATTILGGTVPERDTIGQLCATQIASAIATKNPEEKRLVVIGLGLEKAVTDRAAFMELVDLVFGVI